MSTPNDIEVMLHFYCSRSVHPRCDAPAVCDAVARFLAAGLLAITDDVGVYEPTEGGRMYVRELCAVPWPIQRWVVVPELYHLKPSEA